MPSGHDSTDPFARVRWDLVPGRTTLLLIDYPAIDPVLFQIGPLYALSNLAARTAIGISVPTYLWFWLNFASPSGLSLSDIALGHAILAKAASMGVGHRLRYG